MTRSMKVEEFKERLANAEITRREASAVLASAGVGMATMMFGPGMARAQTELAIDHSLNVFEWGGYDLPEFYTSYVDKYQMQPAFVLFGEEEEALQKLRSGFTADVGPSLHLQYPTLARRRRARSDRHVPADPTMAMSFRV